MAKLIKQESGRYLLAGFELTCGQVIMMKLRARWVKVQIEFSCGDYYGIRVDTGECVYLSHGHCARHFTLDDQIEVRRQGKEPKVW